MKVGVLLDWLCYTYLFRCFLRSPTPRIQEAIQFYEEFKHLYHYIPPVNRAVIAT
jgi:hypothetical protein